MQYQLFTVNSLHRSFGQLSRMRKRKALFACTRRLCNSAHTESAHSPAVESSTTAPLQRLLDRGVLQDAFPSTLLDTNRRLTIKQPTQPVVYAGFDPSAPSLHIGHLLTVNALLQLAAAGFKVIFVVGGATAQLGDPAGQTADRKLQFKDVYRANAESLIAQLNQLVRNFAASFDDVISAPRLDCLVLNNADWYADVGLVSFMSDIGRQLRVGAMLKRAMVRDRMQGDGLPLSEFVYQSLQSYDWLHLYRRYGCALQLGGSDQLGHLDAGFHLIRQLHNEAPVCGFTTPLLTDPSGKKFGKTAAGGTVWLSDQLTRPFQFYQHFRQLHDDAAARYFAYFTFMPLDQMKQLLAEPGAWLAQQRLAADVTALVHGRPMLDAILVDNHSRASSLVYSRRRDASSISALTESECASLCACLPGIDVSAGTQPTTLLQLLRQLHAFDNDKQAANAVRSGAVALNEQRVDDVSMVVECGQWQQHGITTVRWGRRNFALIRWLQ